MLFRPVEKDYVTVRAVGAKSDDFCCDSGRFLTDLAN